MASRVKRKPRKVFAFVDTNIYLDFYRHGNELTLKLLDRLKQVNDKILCTYQVEMEFLKNRQAVLLATLSGLKAPDAPQLPALIADSKTSKSLKEASASARKKARILRTRLVNLLRNPKTNDDVYRVLEKIFCSKSDHVLTRDMPVRKRIKSRALRRFLMGYPPRKPSDTCYGDAINWEWIVHCGKTIPGRMIVVSRDADFGSSVDGKYFLNDQLLSEYKQRVGAKKSIGFTHKLSDALKELQVSVPKREQEAEEQALERSQEAKLVSSVTIPRGGLEELIQALGAFGKKDVPN